MGTFKPVTFLDRTGSPRSAPDPAARAHGGVLGPPGRAGDSAQPCPASGATRRREMTDLVAKLCSRYPDLREKMRTAFLASFWKEKI